MRYFIQSFEFSLANNLFFTKFFDYELLHGEWVVELTWLTALVARMVLEKYSEKRRDILLVIKYLRRREVGSSNVLLREVDCYLM